MSRAPEPFQDSVRSASAMTRNRCRWSSEMRRWSSSISAMWVLSFLKGPGPRKLVGRGGGSEHHIEHMFELSRVLSRVELGTEHRIDLGVDRRACPIRAGADRSERPGTP